MLTLGRKQGQSIVIGGDIIVTVKEIRGSTVRLSIETPSGLPVYREEVHRTIVEENRRAAAWSGEASGVLDAAARLLRGEREGGRGDEGDE